MSTLSRNRAASSRQRSRAVMTALEPRTLLASAFIDPPALPQVFLNTTYVPGAGNTITVNAGGNFQTAINNVQLGDTIVVQAGATFTGNFTLPNKTTGSGWITIRSSAYDELPAPGTRITPVHRSLMARLQSLNDSPVLATPATTPSHHYRFIGIEFTIGPSVAQNFGIISLGVGEQTAANTPHDLIFDRVYIHGNPTAQVQNGMRLNSASTAVIDSYFDECQSTIWESHNIGGYNGPGPYKLVNNTFSSATIPVIFGGANTTVTNLVPSDMEIRNNHFTRPVSWRPGLPTYGGTEWYVKNLFELKNGRRVLFDGNLLEHNWPHSTATDPDGSAQHGYAILLTTKGSQSWTTVEDITITNNVIRKSNVGISISGTEGQGAKEIRIANNLFDEIGLNWGDNDRSGLFTQFQTVGDTIFDHNTIINDGDIMFANGNEVADLDFTNNLSNHNAKRATNFNRGINGPGTGIGTPTLDAKFVQYLVTKNVMANASGGSYTGSAGGNFFPGSSATPGNFSSVGFTSLTNRDYRLAPASVYNNAATDGTDIGANIDVLEAAVGGAVAHVVNGTAGNDTYYLKRNGNLIEIYNNATGTGTPIVRDMFVYYESLHFLTGDGNDTIIVDHSNGSPVPAGGLLYDGGNQTSSDALQVIGNGAAATYSPNGAIAGRGSISVGGLVTLFGLESLSASNLSGLTVVAPGASDFLIVDSPQAGQNRISRDVPGGIPFPPVTIASNIPLTIDSATNEAVGGSVDGVILGSPSLSTVRFIGGAGNDVMGISSGSSLTFNSDLGIDSSALAITVASGATVNFSATQHLRTLSVTGVATMAPNGSRALVTKTLTMIGNGKLNLNNNALIVDYTGSTVLSTVTGHIVTGRNGGSWNGVNGIVTAMSAAIAPSTLTTLGVAEAVSVLNYGAAQTASWQGETVDKTSVLVGYTFTGDATLNGVIDGDDYFAIDAGFSAAATAYASGNFNYAGGVDADDYFLIDANYSKAQIALSTPPAPQGQAELPAAQSFAPARQTNYDRLIEEDQERPLP